MLEKIIRDFVMIWTTVDPISTLAVFAGLTASLSAAERRGVARRGIFYAAIILVVAVVLGQIILDAMGIRLLSLSQSRRWHHPFPFLASKCFLDRSASDPVRTRKVAISLFFLWLFPRLLVPGRLWR